MHPFPAASESSNTTNDILMAILHGGKCLGYGESDFDDAAPAIGFADVTGGIPAGAEVAMCHVEADATEADAARVAMFREDGVDPTASSGMPVGDNGTFEVRGAENIAAFKLIGITAGKIHTLRVQFYGRG